MLLDAVLTRLLVDLKPDETTIDWFEVAFAKIIFNKVISKIQDMYCCTGCCEILNKCFTSGCAKS